MRSLREAIGDLSNPAPDTNMFWAQGCDACTCGIVIGPEHTGAVALYAERLVHAVDGDLTFCDCRAGHMARQHLLRLYRERQKEAKAHGTGDLLGAFDEVAWARQKIEKAYEMMQPTIREAA